MTFREGRLNVWACMDLCGFIATWLPMRRCPDCGCHGFVNLIPK